jgi:hypothetical protein
MKKKDVSEEVEEELKYVDRLPLMSKKTATFLMILVALLIVFIYLFVPITIKSEAPGCTTKITGILTGSAGGCFGKSIATNFSTVPKTSCLHFEASTCNKPLILIQNNCQDNLVTEGFTVNAGDHIKFEADAWFANNTDYGGVRSISGKLGAINIRILYKIEFLC